MGRVGAIAAISRAQRAQPPLDWRLAELAAAQYGVVSLAQLNALGLSDRAARSRVASGRLHRLQRGVYAVGHSRVSREGRWFAAVLACGPGAVLSHRSAAALWDLRPSERGSVDVIAPSRSGRRRPGIDVHRGDTLRPSDTTSVRGVPCTTVARSLLDCSEVLDRRSLERALDRAEVLRLLDARALRDILTRASGRRGAATLDQLLTEGRPGRTLTRSELEERFLELCDGAHVVRPAVNARVRPDVGASFEVDFLWVRERLIVETDGFRVHRTRRAFELDRARDRRLLLAGWRVVRFTWRQVAETPAEVVATLRALLP